MGKLFAVFVWLGALACFVFWCETIYAAGGWALFWTLLGLHFVADVMAKIGVWLWKGRVE